MIWNYRVIQHDRVFSIHEVYYNDNGDITAISEDPMHPRGETLAELRREAEHFLQAFNRPVLKKKKITFAVMDGMPRQLLKRKKESAGKPHPPGAR